MEGVIDYIQPYFEEYGYLIVFGLGVLENSAFVGAIIPGDVVLLLAGFYIQRSSLDLAPVVVLAFAGALIGDSIGYSIGRVGGRRLLNRWGTRFFPEERLARVDRYFQEYGMWAVTLGRITPIIRTVNTFAAGMARMPFPKFLIAVAAAASVWSVTVPVLGMAFSESLELVKSTLGWVGVGIFVLFVVALYLTYHRMTQRLAAEGTLERWGETQDQDVQ